MCTYKKSSYAAIRNFSYLLGDAGGHKLLQVIEKYIFRHEIFLKHKLYLKKLDIYDFREKQRNSIYEYA